MTVLPDTSRDALVDAVVSRMPQLVAEVRDELAERVPDYARFLTDHLESVTRSAGAVAGRIVALMGEPAPGDEVELDLFEELGRSQWREGRALPDLLAAYQIGGRALWRHVSAAALVIGLRSEDLAGLAEAVFFFVDQLSSASAHGYVLEQEESGALRERHRDELVELLLSGSGDATAIRAAARRAEWPVPEKVSVVLVDPDDVRTLTRLDVQALPVRRSTVVGAIVPHRTVRGGERAALQALLRGAHATVGAPVPLELVPRSLALAEIAARLGREHLLEDDPLFVADHLDAIIVHRDQRLLDALGDQVLAPLLELPPTSRDRLRETLRSWLWHMGDRRAMAEELHVHPQTVRYRMNRLHEIFGDALDDPAARARMHLALGW